MVTALIKHNLETKISLSFKDFKLLVNILYKQQKKVVEF